MDSDNTRAYDDWVTWAIWAGEPGAQGSVILAVGSRDTIYAEKTADIDLGFTHAIIVTSEQAENVRVAVGQTLTATETTEGTVRFATLAEERAGTRRDAASTPGGRAAWWASIVADSLLGAISAATRTVAGKVRFATESEERAGARTDAASTPGGRTAWWASISGASLADKVRNASTTAAGKVRFATSAESIAGLIRTVAQTPAGVREYVTARLATRAQAIAGTDNVDLMTPLRTAESVAERVKFFERVFLVTTGNAFPTDAVTGAYHLFLEAVASGLNWLDTNGTTTLTSAAAGDLARFDGTRWVKQAKLTGDVFLEAE